MKNTTLFLLSISVAILSGKVSFSQSMINSSAEIIVEDYFQDNRNGWSLADDFERKTTIRNGIFRHYSKKDKIFYLALPINIDTSRDFVIEGRLSYKRGKAGYGLVFARSDDKNTWRYIVTDRDGNFFIRKIFNGTKTIVQSWKKSAAIDMNGKMNTYSVVKKGYTLKFYANGTFLKETSFSDFNGNLFGFFISGLSTIEAEYFKVAYTDGKNSSFVNNNQNNYNNYNNSYHNNNHNNYNENAAPNIKIREPELQRGFKRVQMEMLRVAGFAKTNVGLFEVKVNGVQAYLGPDGYFSVEVPVKYGDNIITVVATDTKYKSSTQTFKVKRE